MDGRKGKEQLGNFKTPMRLTTNGRDTTKAWRSKRVRSYTRHLGTEDLHWEDESPQHPTLKTSRA